jgi:hypothetical protein
MPAPKLRPNFIKKVIDAARKDPQKAGILTVLVAILVVLQVRLALKDKGGPNRATAASVTTTADNPTAGRTSAARNETRNALQAWLDQPSENINRNLFAVNLDKFPQDSGKITSGTARSALFWDDLAKSMSQQADVKKERRVLYENLAQQASQLRLQSTMMGATPKAVINGELVREGDAVVCGASGTEPGVTFRVLKIEARRIMIEREGIKLEIQMK